MRTISKGLDLPLSGAPEQAVSREFSSKQVAILGRDFHGLKPTMEAAPESGAGAGVGAGASVGAYAGTGSGVQCFLNCICKFYLGSLEMRKINKLGQYFYFSVLMKY